MSNQSERSMYRELMFVMPTRVAEIQSLYGQFDSDTVQQAVHEQSAWCTRLRRRSPAVESSCGLAVRTHSNDLGHQVAVIACSACTGRTEQMDEAPGLQQVYDRLKNL